MLSDTIAAISTSLKDGAIAIVRMSGDEAFEIANKICDRDLYLCRPNSINYAHIIEDGKHVDEVLISVFKGPSSYTAEDMVEINTHGGSYIARKVLSLCLAHGARLAMSGEFTKRAYLNGRIDLAKAESINDMINAKNEIQAKSAMKGIDGSIERLIEPLMNDIFDMIGKIEVNIDYPEYDDVDIITEDILKPKLHKWIEDVKVMIDKAERFRYIKDGIKVAIVGKPNVGKSSLLNALLKEDKAIVTDIAGTTRDIVEGEVKLDNITLHLIDTAGIRESEDVVEKIGIEKSKEAIKKAELVILVLDSSRSLDEEDQLLLEYTKDTNRIIVNNKADIAVNEGLNISAKDHLIDELIDEINRRYEDDQCLIDEDTLNNERQISLLKKALCELMEIKNELAFNLELDIASSYLYEAYHHLSEIIGKAYDDDLIDHLFKNFCLGK